VPAAIAAIFPATGGAMLAVITPAFMPNETPFESANVTVPVFWIWVPAEMALPAPVTVNDSPRPA